MLRHCFAFAAFGLLVGCLETTSTPAQAVDATATDTPRASIAATQPRTANDLCRLPVDVCQAVSQWSPAGPFNELWSAEDTAEATALLQTVRTARDAAYMTCENPTTINFYNRARGKQTSVGVPSTNNTFNFVSVLSVSSGHCAAPPAGGFIITSGR